MIKSEEGCGWAEEDGGDGGGGGEFEADLVL
jgi:hypothetical protein